MTSQTHLRRLHLDHVHALLVVGELDLGPVDALRLVLLYGCRERRENMRFKGKGRERGWNEMWGQVWRQDYRQGIVICTSTKVCAATPVAQA